jgi:hypothetical protein
MIMVPCDYDGAVRGSRKGNVCRTVPAMRSPKKPLELYVILGRRLQVEPHQCRR